MTHLRTGSTTSFVGIGAGGGGTDRPIDCDSDPFGLAERFYPLTTFTLMPEKTHLHFRILTTQPSKRIKRSVRHTLISAWPG